MVIKECECACLVFHGETIFLILISKPKFICVFPHFPKGHVVPLGGFFFRGEIAEEGWMAKTCSESSVTCSCYDQSVTPYSEISLFL